MVFQRNVSEAMNASTLHFPLFVAAVQYLSKFAGNNQESKIFVELFEIYG